MNKFKISYFYHATGMELGAQSFPEMIIQAPSKQMAQYIYYLIFFPAFHKETFEKYLEEKPQHQDWGLTVEEVKND